MQIASRFPPIESAYDEEFGQVDPEVYQIAETLWINAEYLAVKLLNDSPKGLRLMLRAVVQVSRVRKTNPFAIKNLKSYLYRSYKHQLLAELERERCRRDLLDAWSKASTPNADVDEVSRINRQILINELRLKMDDWMRDVFDLLQLGYRYDELVPKYGSAANVIRSKFSKRLASFALRFQAEIQKADEKVETTDDVRVRCTDFDQSYL
ncbi:MAG: hypothetical protein IPN69_23670 [Acidobacteria bacterium]|nr:hypothetical protein [Acidobacteriota bacterium]